MPGTHKKPAREKVRSFSENLFLSKTEQMHDLANVLVQNYREVNHASMRNGKHTTIGRHDLELYDSWLKKAHTYFREASNQELTLTLASEWVLDNYYIIRQTLLQMRDRWKVFHGYLQ
jgi:hypothetical protein